MQAQSKENNEKAPWVTFCMTTFRRPEFLKKQIRSILNQTLQDFAVIISDNDVDESGRTVIESFDDERISYYVNEVNVGMVKSFNRSLLHARSEYVVMITDDDPVYPEMLEILFDLTKQYPGYGMYMGGCDIVCYNPIVADSSRLKVGTNSCLAPLPIGTVREYSGSEFPFAYFQGKIGGHLLWSTGIVRREIAIAVDGMPDFGAPYNTDFGYIVLCGSQSGIVLINTSLGAQVVHGQNYGFTESDFDKLYVTPEAFLHWVMNRLPKESNYVGLEKYIQIFLARWVVEYAVSIHKFIRRNRKSSENFNEYLRKVFHISFLRNWRWKYYAAVFFPKLFEFSVYLKSKIVT